MTRYAFHGGALKRGYHPDEIKTAWESWADQAWLDDDRPGRLLRISFDAVGRPIELIGIVFDDGARVLFIHAMPLRQSTIDLLTERR